MCSQAESDDSLPVKIENKKRKRFGNLPQICWWKLKKED